MKLLENDTIIAKLEDHKKIALIYKDDQLSYTELIQNINSYASLLDTLPDQRVAIVCENRPEWIYALYATWQRGSIVVPIDYLSTPEEISYVLSDSEPSAIFCSAETYRNVEEALNLSNLSAYIYNVDNIILPKAKGSYIHRNINDVAVIFYTSGTTGNPKGVMISFRNLMSNIEAIKELQIVGKEDKTIALLPFHHSYPFMTTLLIPLHIGACIVFLEKLSSEALIQTMQKNKISVLVGVPRLYQLLHQRIQEKIESSFLSKGFYSLFSKFPKPIRKLAFRKVHKTFGGKLKFMVSGGAKLPLDTAKFLDSLGFNVIEGYGLTETSPIVSFNPPNKIKLGSVGLPIKGVEAKVDEDGELLVKGPNVMLGYYKKPEETRKAFKNGYLKTGDLAYIDEEGYIYIEGRKKEIIVLAGGKNVNPEEIENMILKRDKLVKECAVLEIDGSLKAILHLDENVIKERGIVNLEEYVRWNILDKVNSELPSWKKLTGFKIVFSELPKTRLGKLKRYKLFEVYNQAKVKSPEKSKALQTPVAKALRNFLSKYTNKEVYGHEHMELDLGLDSLGKVELLSFIESSFGLSISEKELSGMMSLDKLIEFIEKHKEREELVSINWSYILKEFKPFEVESSNLPFNLGRLVLYTFFKLYNSLEVIGIQNIPQGPCIFAPNHASYLDGFVLACALPKEHATNTFFLGEEAYFRGKLRGSFAKLAHVITINLNKDLKGSMQKAAYVLKMGKKLVIFPEGARTRDGNLLPFKKGFSILSKELGIPIVPVAILGTYESMSIRDKFPKPAKIKVMFLEAIYPNTKSYEDITQETFESIKRVLEKER